MVNNLHSHIEAQMLHCYNPVLGTGRVMNSCTYARIGAAVMNETFSLVPNVSQPYFSAGKNSTEPH